MQEYRLRGRKRVAAGILAFLVLSVLLFSAFFIAFEAHHDCSGEDDCNICFCMDECGKAILQVRFGYGSAVRTVVSLFLFLLTAAAVHFVFVLTFETPVSRKVQLND